MVNIIPIPTQYTKWCGLRFIINNDNDIIIIKNTINSIIKNKRKQYIQIQGDIKYINEFPEFDNNIQNNNMVLLHKYF